MCQGIQTWSIWERDSIYRLDLSTNEGNFLSSWAAHFLELKSQLGRVYHGKKQILPWPELLLEHLSPLCSRCPHPSEFPTPLYAPLNLWYLHTCGEGYSLAFLLVLMAELDSENCLGSTFYCRVSRAKHPPSFNSRAYLGEE